jgi:hypothetical protein
MSDYTLTPAEYRSCKAQLTRALNRTKAHPREPQTATDRATMREDWQRVAGVAAACLATFERKGYPDDWSRWQRAADDAQAALVRLRVTGGSGLQWGNLVVAIVR